MTVSTRTLFGITCLVILMGLFASGPTTPAAAEFAAAQPSFEPWRCEGDEPYVRFGVSVGTAGDVNGDSYADVIVGADLYPPGYWGRTWSWYGSHAGLERVEWIVNDYDWTEEGSGEYCQSGFSVGTAGDVNGDGYDDAIIGWPGHWLGNGAGAVRVAYGSAAGLRGPIAGSTWWESGNQEGALFGYCVGTAGDVNGDGYSDIVVGQPFYSNGQAYEGCVYVYCGSASGLSTEPDWIMEGNAENGLFGVSASTAGDVNADGYDDIIAGRPNPSAVESLVSGNAYLFYGSASGLSTSPDWIGVGGQPGALFGASVSVAGDVNSDNYSDVIVGEPGYSNGQLYEGRACVYYGSASGPSDIPDWIAEGNQQGASFGQVSRAGDVNGDGYDDIIIGAPDYSSEQIEEGRVFIYDGSASGLISGPSQTAEGNQAGAHFGASLGTAGDVNGDGCDDVIVGAPGYDRGQTDEGRACVFYGSTEGLSVPPNRNPTASNDVYTILEDNDLRSSDAGRLVGALGVLHNDSDPDNDALTAILVTDVSNGTLRLNANGSFVFIPKRNFSGTDSFTYRVNDGTADSSIATVTIKVNPVNDAPIAGEDTYSVDEDGSLTVSPFGVLQNDIDVEGDSTIAILVTSASRGTLSLDADGSFSYTPADDFNGNDSFTYKASDGKADSRIATVTIIVNPVNDAPVAVKDAYSVDEDGILAISSSGVLGNDINIDEDTLSAIGVTRPIHGSLSLNADGSFTYFPAADFCGTDSFEYKAFDGALHSDTAIVTIAVRPTNDAPVARNDTYSVHGDSSLTVSASGVLRNDRDVDGDTLTALLEDDANHGSLTLNANGSFSYVPNSGFSGSDSFSYKANDGQACSEVCKVTIDVKSTPNVVAILVCAFAVLSILVPGTIVFGLMRGIST